MAFELIVEQFNVRIDHQFHQFAELNLWPPAKDTLRFARVALENIDLSWPEIPGINLHVFFPIEIGVLECVLQKFSNAMGLTSGDHKIISCVQLHHAPHRFDVLRGIAPVTFGLKVSHIELVLQTGANSCNAPGDLAAYESFPRRGDSWLKRIPLQANIS